jgi:nucleotide-binding universal stress UspA family protein
MFQRILLPLDGSVRAERAIPIAARLARASDGSIIMVRVVRKASDMFSSLASQPTLAQRILGADFAQAEHYLADVATSADLQSIPLQIEVRFGPVVSSILAVADDCEADVIVLCSHGYSGLRRRIMGSVAEQLARHATTPMLVLRENGPLPAELHETDPRPLRALVALDSSEQAEVVLEPAARLVAALADQSQNVLHLLRVVQPVMANSEPGGMLTESERAKRYLEEVANQIREGVVAPAAVQHGLDVTWSVAVDTYVVETLTQAGGKEANLPGFEGLGDCDLVALAASERDGVQHWAMGNFTQHLLLDGQFPLFIVPVQRQDRQVKDEQGARVGDGDQSFNLLTSLV